MRSGFAFRRLLFAVLGMLLLVVGVLRVSLFLCALGFGLLIFFRFLELSLLALMLLIFLGFALLYFLVFLSSFACSWPRGNCWRNSE